MAAAVYLEKSRRRWPELLSDTRFNRPVASQRYARRSYQVTCRRWRRRDVHRGPCWDWAGTCCGVWRPSRTFGSCSCTSVDSWSRSTCTNRWRAAWAYSTSCSSPNRLHRRRRRIRRPRDTAPKGHLLRRGRRRRGPTPSTADGHRSRRCRTTTSTAAWTRTTPARTTVAMTRRTTACTIRYISSREAPTPRGPTATATATAATALATAATTATAFAATAGARVACPLPSVVTVVPAAAASPPPAQWTPPRTA